MEYEPRRSLVLLAGTMCIVSQETFDTQPIENDPRARVKARDCATFCALVSANIRRASRFLCFVSAKAGSWKVHGYTCPLSANHAQGLSYFT